MNYKIKLIIYSAVLLFVLSATSILAYSSASLFIFKSTSSVQVGDRITLSIKVKSTEQSINAVSGSVYFSEDLFRVVSVSKSKTIVNLWTREPSIQRNRINFEGIILNPGYQGSSGNIFDISFEAKKPGDAIIRIGEGAVLANDGQGTNILDSLDSTKIKITPRQVEPYAVSIAYTDSPSSKPIALPVITDYSASVLSKTQQSIYVKGKGEPNALTKISFKDSSIKSLGEQFIAYLQSKKKKLGEVLVKNDATGSFQYVSPTNLLAGAYNATPYLVDQTKNTERPGLGVQLLVSDSKIVRYIVILINVLGLLIPVVGLIVIIYFIPWYSWLRMRILKKRMGLEEEKIELTEHQLKRQDIKLDEDRVPKPPTS